MIGGGGADEDIHLRMMEQAEADYQHGGGGGGGYPPPGSPGRVGRGGYNARSGEDEWVYEQPGSATSGGGGGGGEENVVIITEPTSARGPRRGTPDDWD